MADQMAHELKQLRGLVGRMLKIMLRQSETVSPKAPGKPTPGKPAPAKPAVTPVGAEFENPEYQRKLAQVQRDFAVIFGDGAPCEEMRIVQPDGSEIPVRRKGRGFWV